MMMGPAPMMRTECMSVRFGIVKPPQIEHGLKQKGKENLEGFRRFSETEILDRGSWWLAVGNTWLSHEPPLPKEKPGEPQGR